MADAQRTVDLIFNGVDNASATIDGIVRNTSKFADNVTTATQPLADFTVGLLKTEAAIIAAGVAVTGLSIKLASDFQSAAAELNKVLGETESIETYKDLAIELGEAYGVSSTDLLEAIANYKQAGFTAEEAGQLTKNGLDLVIAGGLEAADAAQLLVQSIKGFGASANDAGGFIDLLNAVANQYNANVQQLLEGFATLSPVAKTAGLSLQETIGVLVPGIEVFGSGAEVANSLRTAFLRLIDDNPTVVNALDSIGVAQRDANGELRSARDIYFDAAAALQGLDENQRLYIASQLAGINRSSQFLAVTDGLSDSLLIASDAFEFVGSAAKEVELQLATAENAANRTKVAFVNLLGAFGEPFLDEFSGVSDALTAIFKSLREVFAGGQVEGVAELVGFIEGQFLGLQETLENVAKNLPAALEQADLSGFTDGLRAVSDAIGGLFDGFDLDTPEGLAKAISAAGNAFNLFQQSVAGVIESFGPIVSLVFDAVEGLGDLDPELFKATGNFLGLGAQVNFVAGAFGGLLPSIEALVSLLLVKQGIGLVGALASAAGGFGALGAAGAAFGVAAAGGFGIGNLVVQLDEAANDGKFVTWVSDLIESFADGEAGVNALSAELERAIPITKSAGQSFGVLADDANDTGDGFARLADQFIETTTGLKPLAAASSGLSDSFGVLASDANDLVGELIPYADAIESAADSTVTVEAATKRTGGTLSFVKNEFSEAAKKVRELSDAGKEIDLEERLALIDAQSAITVAQIEADTDRIKAAFESVGNSIDSTADVLNNLYDLFADPDISLREQFQIERQIEAERELREKAFKLQERLTNAQIREIEARARALEGGDALITINGDGLQPHLEAFMFEVLEAVQVRTNSEGLGLLLGV